MKNQKEQFLEHFETARLELPIQKRARAIIHNGLDFPTTKHERWKYTKVTKIIEGSYNQHVPNIQDISAFVIDQSWAYLVFVNGQFQADLSDTLPRGVMMQTLAETDVDASKVGKLTNLDKEAFQSLNTAYFNDGAVLKVSGKVETPIAILNIAQGEAQITNTRMLIHVESGAEVQFVNQFEGYQNGASFTNAMAEVIVDAQANAEFYLIENEGEESRLITATNVSQEKDSTFSMATITKSGKLVRNNIHMAITEPGCESNMMGIYFTDNDQHVDNQTYADHQDHSCNSNELYKGVMAGKSTGVFNGKIMVHQKAQQTNAFQSNQNILLSDKATINTKPELEIYADDVKCSHGCTIGQLDEEALFYLQSRGLDRDAAYRLLVQAFAGDVIQKINISSLRENVEQFIEGKFE